MASKLAVEAPTLHLVRECGESFLSSTSTFILIAIRLHPCRIIMTIDRGTDFPSSAQRLLDQFSRSDNACTHSHCLWRYRDRHGKTTKAVNVYRGDKRE